MLKKITLSVLVATMLFAAQNKFDSISLESISKGQLLEIENANRPISNLILAQAYEVGFPEKGIPKDNEKAIKLYKKVYDVNKDPIACSKLGMYYFAKEVKENKDYNSEKYFKDGISKLDLKMNEYNGIMLGIVFYSKKEFNKANEYLLKYANIGNPTAELYLAFSYNETKKEFLANKYLTRACTNPKSTKDILQYCNTNTSKEDLDSLLDIENESSCSAN